MICTLERPLAWRTPTSTTGRLYLGNNFFCYTLEDTVREYPNKVAGKTAIWEGVYSMVIDYSTRFKRMMPHVLDVPLFEGIRIHSGNTAEDTEGCILVGLQRANDRILQSRIAFDALFLALESSLKQDFVRLVVTSDPVPMKGTY